MAISFFLVDTFTNDRFKGNPAPICLLGKVLDKDCMHALAKEFNLPVTAFIEPPTANNTYPIRYFTTTGEIPACGHATLGAAYVILNGEAQHEVTFKTIESINLKARNENQIIYVEYPRFSKADFYIPDLLLGALGIKNVENHFFCPELESLFIELSNDHELAQITPNYQALVESSSQIKEVVVMSRSGNPAYDFVLRSFCPWIGIDEDPVTGSVHSVLAHYWQEKTGKDALIAYQASSRGGEVYLKPKKDKVELGGKTVILISGELTI